MSQGINDEFSTGSQAQYPPQPNSLYAQYPPKIIPAERKVQTNKDHLLIDLAHSKEISFEIKSTNQNNLPDIPPLFNVAVGFAGFFEGEGFVYMRSNPAGFYAI